MRGAEESDALAAKLKAVLEMEKRAEDGVAIDRRLRVEEGALTGVLE